MSTNRLVYMIWITRRGGSRRSQVRAVQSIGWFDIGAVDLRKSKVSVRNGKEVRTVGQRYVYCGCFMEGVLI